MPGRRARTSTLHFVRSGRPASTGPDDCIVALTPSALGGGSPESGALVLDDLVDRAGELPDPVPYTRWQIGWIRRLDDALGAEGAAEAGAQLLKAPIDSLVVMSRMLGAAVRAADPEAIAYVGRTTPGRVSPWHNGHLQPWASLGDLPLAAQLLPLISQHASLPFTATEHPEHVVSLGEQATSRWRTRAKWLLGPLRNVGIAPPGRSPSGASLLLWTGGYGLRQLVAEERRQGRRVLVLERSNAVTSLLAATLLGYRRRSPRIDISLPPMPETALSGIDALLAEIDGWARLDGAGELLRERLEVFCLRVVPAIQAASDQLAPLIEEMRVDQLIAANPWSIEEFAVLRAGAGRTRRVLVQHGDHAYSYASWQVSELQNFETLRTSDPTVVEDLELHAPAGRVLAIVEDNPRVVRRPPRARPSRPTVCYLPLIMIDEAYVHPAGYIDGAWYHRWHVRLLDHLAAAPGVDVIWKVLRDGDQTPDPMPALIEQLGAPSVRLETRPFLEVLPTVDALVTDYLSTGLYEAINAGVPSLAIHFERFGPIRAGAARDLAPSLRPCRDEDAALLALSEFLDGDWSTYVVPRPPAGAES